jgi:hypothetical protein
MGLGEGDLKNLVEKVFEVDSYKSKMGDDKNIVVVAFSLKQKAAADDLASFIEKGYSSVLDADATPGEQSDGTYKVFAELERDKEVAEQIRDMLDGIERLAKRLDFRFRYYKNFRSQEATQENLDAAIPKDPESYEIAITENRLNNYKDFFNRSYLDEISMLDDHLVLKKKWADPLDFKFIDFGDAVEIKESQAGTFDVLNAYPEIMYLTKYIGDYAVSKYGDNIVLENEDKALVLRRLR